MGKFRVEAPDRRFVVVAYLRRRGGGRFSLVIYWDGKKHPKGLCTTDPAEAATIKREAEEETRRIRSGQSPEATRLLDEDCSIMEVLFGGPSSDPEISPLTLRQLPLMAHNNSCAPR